MNTFYQWLAWKLPKRLVYWCYIRVVSNATTYEHETQVVPELTVIEALERWKFI